MKTEEQNKFYPTKNWRLRGELHDLVHQLEADVGCLVYADNNHLYNKDNFEFSLNYACKTLRELKKFYNKNK